MESGGFWTQPQFKCPTASCHSITQRSGSAIGALVPRSTIISSGTNEFLPLFPGKRSIVSGLFRSVRRLSPLDLKSEPCAAPKQTAKLLNLSLYFLNCYAAALIWETSIQGTFWMEAARQWRVHTLQNDIYIYKLNKDESSLEATVVEVKV